MIIIQSLQFTCYYPNSTVTLVSQTQAIEFQAWPATTDSICATLDKKPFVPLISLGGLSYQHAQINYDTRNPITLTVPCGDAVTHCAAAFSALSATYYMSFTENELTFDATVSEFFIERFDLGSCITDQVLQVDKSNKKIMLVADFSSCNVVLYGTGDALAVANFSLQMGPFSSYSLIQLPAAATKNNLAQYLVMDCSVPSTHGACTQQLENADSLDQYASLSLALPLKIRSPYPAEPYRVKSQRLYTVVRKIVSLQTAALSCVSVNGILLFETHIAVKTAFSRTAGCDALYSSVDSLSIAIQLADSKNERRLNVQLEGAFSPSLGMMWMECDSNACQEFQKSANTASFEMYAAVRFGFPLHAMVATTSAVEKHQADNAQMTLQSSTVLCASAAVKSNADSKSTNKVVLQSKDLTLEQITTVPNSQNLYCFNMDASTIASAKKLLEADELTVFSALGQYFPVMGYQDSTKLQYQSIGGWFILAAVVLSITFAAIVGTREK